MKIFVFEYITGGGLGPEPLSPSLAHEGEAMLRALADDLSQDPELEVMTCRDAGLGPLNRIVAASYDKCMQWADAVWPIAPETSGVLETVSREILARGKILLGSDPQAVCIAASKMETARILARAGVPVAPVFTPNDELPEGNEWVVKPDDGAGCLETRLFHSRDEARSVARSRQHMLQAYVRGTPCSLSLLCCKGQARLLSCNRQKIDIADGRFSFLGCEVNAFDDADGKLAQLAAHVARALPGLWGYCGVDFMQSSAGAVVIEVNPRLTTSYVGLSKALGENVALLVMRLPR